MNQTEIKKVAFSVIASMERKGGTDDFRPRVGKDDVVVAYRQDCDRAGDVECEQEGFCVGFTRAERVKIVAEIQRQLKESS